MLKINLLPSYIYDRRNRNRAIVLMSIVCVLVLAAMISWSFKLNAEKAALQLQVDDMEQKAKQVNDLKAQVTAEQSKAPAIEAKVKFIEDLREYNVKVPALYHEVAKFTYSRISYSSMALGNGTLTMKAHAKSLGDCGRYLLNMYRATHLYKSVTISGIPSWSPGPGVSGFDFDVNCTLVTPISAPAAPAGVVSLGGGTAGGGGVAGAGGMPTATLGAPLVAPRGDPRGGGRGGGGGGGGGRGH